jgi:mRNA interferase RelE/StbE
MIFQRTERFKRMYEKLDSERQKAIKRAIKLMADNIYHSSLRVKRLQGTKGIWEASATIETRITFNWENDTIIFRNCGEHDKTLKSP